MLLTEIPGERVEWTSHADLPGCEILRADNCSHRWRVYHETFTVCTGSAGRWDAYWRYRNRDYVDPWDGVMLMEPGEVHVTRRLSAPASFRVFMMVPALVEAAARQRDIAGDVHLRRAQSTSVPLHQAFRALHATLESASTLLERHSRLAVCLEMLIGECAERRARERRGARERAGLERARSYIHAHAEQPISLSTLTQVAGAMSEYALVHAFRRQHGLPPHAYQIHLRIGRSRELLTLGASAADVAISLGFADQSHFTRHFRKIMRMTPAAYCAAVARQRKAATTSRRGSRTRVAG